MPPEPGSRWKPDGLRTVELPDPLMCGLCHVQKAENWTIEGPLQYVGGSMLDFEAVPVCHDCTPRITMGDRPPEICAVTRLGLVREVEGP